MQKNAKNMLNMPKISNKYAKKKQKYAKNMHNMQKYAKICSTCQKKVQYAI